MKTRIIIAALAIAFLHIISANSYADVNYDEVENLFKQGRLDEAETLLTEEARHNSKDPVPVMLLGELYRERGDRNKAIKFLDKAVSLDPEYPMSYFYRGKVFFLMQKLDDAESNFGLYMQKMRPILSNEENRALYISRLHEISHMYFSLKMYEKSKEAMDEALRVSPKDQVALYNIGIYYYTYERKRPMAYRYLSKAVEIDPSSQAATRARYAIEFMRSNLDPRVEPDFDFLDNG